MPAAPPDIGTLLGTLHRFTAAIESAGVDYALIGGLARNAWTHARATVDIDLAVQ